MSNEYLFRDRLINFIVVMWAGLSSVATILCEIRAFDTGWSYKDPLFIIITVCGVGTALYRKKIPTRIKAIGLILVNLIVGIAVFFTLGILSAGLVFIFLAAVIMALFLSERTVGFYVLILLACLFPIGAGLYLNTLTMTVAPELLLTNPLHWTLYIFCMAYFLVISCVTILAYRRAMGQLVDEASSQRDKLAKSNAELHKALNEIKILKRILPVCSFCKKIRNDVGEWENLESYLDDNSNASVSHGICPGCMARHYPEVDYVRPLRGLE